MLTPRYSCHNEGHGQRERCRHGSSGIAQALSSQQTAPRQARIIARPCLSIAQDRVGLVDPLEARFRPLVGRTEIRMVFLGQLSESRLDFVIACSRPQAEHLVQSPQATPNASCFAGRDLNAPRFSKWTTGMGCTVERPLRIPRSACRASRSREVLGGKEVDAGQIEATGVATVTSYDIEAMAG